MPFFRHPRTFTPLRIEAEKKTLKNGLRHTIFTSKLDTYVGEWKNNLKEGKGYFMTIGGKLYEGDWYKGFRHGHGNLSNRLPNGTYRLEYCGNWVRGKPEGAGWKYYPNGDIYFGFWKEGNKYGYGKMWYADGTYYVGYWKLDKKNGLGMFVQQNSNRYEGHWVDDLKDGLGRFYHLQTGQLQEGIWKKDICIKSKMVDICIRQCCPTPTPYPIPREKLLSALHMLELSEFWLKQKVGEIDKNVKYCIDQM